MKKKAFTLVELLVVVLILGFLVAIAIPRFSKASDTAKITSCDANVVNINKAIELYMTDNNGAYPTVKQFKKDILRSTDYFPHGEPTCPYEQDYQYNATDRTVPFHSH